MRGRASSESSISINGAVWLAAGASPSIACLCFLWRVASAGHRPVVN